MADTPRASRSEPPGRRFRVGARARVVARGVWWEGEKFRAEHARLVSGGSFALLGCTVAPGFEFEDYESGTRESLIRQYPSRQELSGK